MSNLYRLDSMTSSHVLLRSVLFSCFLLILGLPREFDDVQRCVSTLSFDSVCLNREGLFHGSANECFLLWFLSSWDHQNSSTWDICICLNVHDIPRDTNNKAPIVPEEHNNKTCLIIYAKRSKRSRRPCLYYANCCACFHLSLRRCGDIEANPGPKKSQKCQECEQTLRKNQKQINCKSCFDVFLVKCVCLSNDITTTQNNFKCTRCLRTELPFHAHRDIYNTDHELFSSGENPSNISATLDPGPDKHLQSLIMRPKHLKVMHLNTQSMVSAFDELLLTIKQYPFDVIA